jgi:hypothetical protein
MEKVKIDDAKLIDIIDRLNLSSRLRCSIVMMDGIANRQLSIDFPGGTLADFIDALCLAADARIVYGAFSVNIVPKTPQKN